MDNGVVTHGGKQQDLDAVMSMTISSVHITGPVIGVNDLEHIEGPQVTVSQLPKKGTDPYQLCDSSGMVQNENASLLFKIHYGFQADITRV